MAYRHGVYVSEVDTQLTVPVQTTSGLQVVIGTAPVHLAEDPAKALEPKLVTSYKEAVAALGYSIDFERYTLCQAVYASFMIQSVGPLVLINVLDPTRHIKAVDGTASVADGKAVWQMQDVLLDGLVVKGYNLDTDYSLAHDDDGNVVITINPAGAAVKAKELNLSALAIDPTLVTAADIVGGVSRLGVETGLQALRQVYPKFGMTPGIVIAPGWSHLPEVSVVMQGKTTGINGNLQAVCICDIDSGESGAQVYTEVKEQKEAQALNTSRCFAVWPKAEIGDVTLWRSATVAALLAATDAANEDTPALSPSNKNEGITGTVTASGVEIYLDQEQANIVNSYGVNTALNLNGWRNWGNRTAIYPASTDPKDSWINIRRMYCWWANTICVTHLQNVDSLLNPRLRDEIVVSENIRGNYFVNRGWVATAHVDYLEAENPITDLLNGVIRFHIYLSPYPAAEVIEFIMEYDVGAVASAMGGDE